VEFRVLGPLEVVEDRQAIPITGPRERALIALLLIRPGEVVSADGLIDLLWGDDIPRNAPNALQAVVARVRRALGPRGKEILVTKKPGYTLAVGPDQVDVLRFEHLIARARDLVESDPATASSLFRQALGLWRGSAFQDLADEVPFQQEIARLEELQLSAQEDRIEADLSLGRFAEVVGEIEALIATHPFRERLRQQLMLALYGSGRQADALRVYQETRTLLSDELGLDPVTELQELHERILRQDASLAESRAKAPVRRHNLPARITSFIGRDSELEDVRRLLGRSRVVTVIGPGGSGKTSIAIEVARSLFESADDRTTRTAFFVDLSPVTDPSHVPMAGAAAIGLRGGPGGATGTPTPPDVQVEDFVRANEPLLLLDNCEHVVGPVASFADKLLRAAPGARILATSREPLGLTGEVAWSIPGLATPEASVSVEEIARFDAVRLFKERAAAAKPGFRIDERTGWVAGKICRRLDGLPLAIELAAARVRALPLEEIARRLDDRFRLLTAGERTAAPRQQTLRATIDWSYNLLSERERLLFARLSVFPGTWALDAAEAISGDRKVPAQEILDLVSALVDKSMVSPEPGRAPRFRMLETIREYARERLEESGQSEDLRRRHAAYFLELAQAAASHPESRQWLRALEEAADDIGAALDWALDVRATEIVLKLAGFLGWYWATWHDQEGISRMKQVLASVQPTPSAEFGRALLASAFVESYAPSPATKERATKSVELLESFGDWSGAGRARLILAFIELMLGGDPDFAERHIEAADTAFAEGGDHWGRALASLSRFRLSLHAGSLKRAIEAGHDALERFGALGDPWGLPWTTMWLGIATRMMGDIRSARKLFEAAIAASEELDYVRCYSHAELGCLAALEGSREAARNNLDIAEELAPNTGVHDSLAIVANAVGFAARLRGDPTEAKTNHLRALAVFEGLASEIGIAYTSCCLGYVEHHLGEVSASARHLGEALEVAERTGRLDIAAAAFEGVACVVASRDAEICALLLGAARRIRDDTGIRLTLIEGPDPAEACSRARAALGAVPFSVALEKGRRSPRDQMRLLALQVNSATSV
jgi:predicted ATPase/DNA-binding winged helix-turn-helix (wHTH) protein